LMICESPRRRSLARCSFVSAPFRPESATLGKSCLHPLSTRSMNGKSAAYERQNRPLPEAAGLPHG
jgi:hypothetical protein